MSCLNNFGRVILITLNVIFVVTGIAIMGICIFLKVDETSRNVQEVIEEHADAQKFSRSIVVLVVLGASILLISGLGCCAAIFENRCLLGTYIFLLTVITIAEFGAGIFVAVVRNTIRDHVTEAATEVIEEKYNTSKSIASAIDILQAKLKCCGANNYTDFYHLKIDEGKVPYSCCVLKNIDDKTPDPVNKTECELEAKNPNLQQAKYLHTKGCVHALENMVVHYSTIILGVALGIAGFEIFLVCLACCICRKSDSEDDRLGLIH
ncbi:CD63 antigen-like [Argonauta hians]